MMALVRNDMLVLLLELDEREELLLWASSVSKNVFEGNSPWSNEDGAAAVRRSVLMS
jgi:hypothetical protein